LIVEAVSGADGTGEKRLLVKGSGLSRQMMEWDEKKRSWLIGIFGKACPVRRVWLGRLCNQ